MEKKRTAPPLVGEEIVMGYSYNSNVKRRIFFEGTPENIANFIYNEFAKGSARTVVTDFWDYIVCSASGVFLNKTRDEELRSAVLDHLRPLQQGRVQPYDVRELDYEAEYYAN